MPLLKSGRAVGIQPRKFDDDVIVDENGELQELTLGYRPQVSTVDDLLSLLPIMYFDVKDERPIMESMRKSGFTVGEIIAGADNWTPAEIEELTPWAKANADLQSWLQEHLAAIKLQELQDRARRHGE